MSDQPVYGQLQGFTDRMRNLARRAGDNWGTDVLYTPSRRCSCVTGRGQARVDCKVCKGFGFFWVAGDEEKLRCQISQAVAHRDLVLTGFIERTDLVVTLERRRFTTRNDRIRMARVDLFGTFSGGESEVLVRAAAGAVDPLPYRVARINTVQVADPETGAVTDYRPGVDVVAEGAALRWPAHEASPVAGATAPPRDARYTLDYLADYDWLVQEPPAPRTIAHDWLGGRLLVRRWIRDQRRDDEQTVAANVSRIGLRN